MKTLFDQWQAMLERNIIPVLEYQIAENDWVVVNISIEPDGFYFNFDENSLPTHFSGDIYKKGDSYLLKFDECFDDLDYYLQMISEEIADGYLLPNDLYYSEDN